MHLRYFQLVVLLVVLAGSAAQAASEASELERMFRWWNGAMARPDGFSAEGFRRHFTEDAVITINGTERVRGIDAMVARFRDIQSSTDSVVVQVPFIEEFRSGEKIFTYHESYAVIDGRAENDLVMGYAVIRDGKIALVNFLNYQPGAE